LVTLFCIASLNGNVQNDKLPQGGINTTRVVSTKLSGLNAASAVISLESLVKNTKPENPADQEFRSNPLSIWQNRGLKPPCRYANPLAMALSKISSYNDTINKGLTAPPEDDIGLKMIKFLITPKLF
jgi:hypothetical protein